MFLDNVRRMEDSLGLNTEQRIKNDVLFYYGKPGVY